MPRPDQSDGRSTGHFQRSLIRRQPPRGQYHAMDQKQLIGNAKAPGRLAERLNVGELEILRPLLLDASGATGATTQVVQLGAANAAATGHLDLVDARRMDEEGPLDPDPV